VSIRGALCEAPLPVSIGWLPDEAGNRPDRDGKRKRPGRAGTTEHTALSSGHTPTTSATAPWPRRRVSRGQLKNRRRRCRWRRLRDRARGRRRPGPGALRRAGCVEPSSAQRRRPPPRRRRGAAGTPPLTRHDKAACRVRVAVKPWMVRDLEVIAPAPRHSQRAPPALLRTSAHCDARRRPARGSASGGGRRRPRAVNGRSDRARLAGRRACTRGGCKHPRQRRSLRQESPAAMDERSSVRGQYRLDDAPGLQPPSSAAASRVDLEADN
jgi:hypothetical protein